MPQDYIRCHYTSPEGIECASWFPRGEGNLCIVHRGIVSTSLASNGIAKEEYIGARKEAETSLRARLQGLDSQAQCNLLDAHIAGIEKIIEEQKTLALTARAIRSEVIEGLSEDERQIRRRMKVPISEKKSTKKIQGTPEQMIEAFRSKWPNMTVEAAKAMLGLD
jgi:hypothetical protein